MKEIKTVKSKATKTTAKFATAKALEAPSPVKRAAKKASTVIETVSAPIAIAAPASPMLSAPRREITTDLIARRAYVIWEQQGCPHGRDVANWLLAETQLKQEIQSFTA